MGHELDRLTSAEPFQEGAPVRFRSGTLAGIQGVVVEDRSSGTDGSEYVVSVCVLNERVTLIVNGRMLEATTTDDSEALV